MTYRVVALCVLVGLLAFIPAALYVDFRLLVTVLDAIAVTMGLGILAGYNLGLIRQHSCLQSWRKVEPSYLLVTGIVISWAGIVGRIGWTYIWRVNGEPWWMLDHWFPAFCLWVVIIGAALYITARNAIEHSIPASNWIWLGVAFTSGIALGALAL